MFPLLALVASVAAVASARPSNPLALERRTGCTRNGLIFDPPTLTLDDSDFKGSFTVKLAAEPKGDVAVYLDGTDILFSDAVLAFDSSNWNKGQKVSVIADADFYGDIETKTIKIEADIDAPCDNLCPQDYTGTRTKYPGQTCGWTGDPHISTFDSLYVFFRGQGVYDFIKSEHLNVQGYLYPCTWNGKRQEQATCTGAVAIRYGDSAVILSLVSDDYKNAALNGKQIVPKLHKVTDDISGMTWTPKNGDASDTWVITLADGSNIHVTAGYSREMNHLDVSVFLAAGYYGTCGGLCNQHLSDGKGDGMLHGSNGKQYSLESADDIVAWGETWAVDSSDSLFESHYKPGKVTYPVDYIPVKGGKAPQYHDVCPSTTTPVTSTAAPSKTTAVTSSVASSYTSKVSTTEHGYPTTIVTSTVAPSKTSTTSKTVPSTYTTKVESSSTKAAHSTSTKSVIVTTSTVVKYTTTAVPKTTTTTTCTLPKYTPSSYTYTRPATHTSTVAPYTTSVPAGHSTSSAAPYKSSTFTFPKFPPSTAKSSSAPAKTTSTTPAKYPTSTAAPAHTTIHIYPISTTTSSAPVSTATCIGTVTNPATNRTYPIIQCPSYVLPTHDQVAAAESHCDALLTTGCQKVLPVVHAAYMSACVADILSTGSYIFCETTRRAFHQRCAKVIGQMAASSNAAVAEPAAQVQTTAGYNAAKCPKSCSGNGVCGECGCKCAAPFTGPDCGIDMTKLPVIQSPAAGATVNQFGGNVTYAVAPRLPLESDAAPVKSLDVYVNAAGSVKAAAGLILLPMLAALLF
ncbi:hypothetical protein HK101_010031 [Irineochytrium annulatum]|nr:hypothetical protein HK101_010031 [Irineochytrium annulatum]